MNKILNLNNSYKLIEIDLNSLNEMKIYENFKKFEFFWPSTTIIELKNLD